MAAASAAVTRQSDTRAAVAPRPLASPASPAARTPPPAPAAVAPARPRASAPAAAPAPRRPGAPAPPGGDPAADRHDVATLGPGGAAGQPPVRLLLAVRHESPAPAALARHLGRRHAVELGLQVAQEVEEGVPGRLEPRGRPEAFSSSPPSLLEAEDAADVLDTFADGFRHTTVGISLNGLFFVVVIGRCSNHRHFKNNVFLFLLFLFFV